MSHNGLTILHVEDDPNDLLLVQRAFRKANVEAALHSVQDGDAAIEYLSGSGAYEDRQKYPLPNLVLLDLKIPRRSGLEVLSWLRQEKSIRRIPVVVLTSSRHDRDINVAYDMGTNSYLVKPVGFDALLEMVRLLESYWLKLNEKPTPRWEDNTDLAEPV